MPVEILFILYLSFLMLVVIYQLFLRPPTINELLQRGMEDIKEGRTTTYTRCSWKRRLREEKKWEKAHPIKHFINECGWWIRHIFNETIEFPNNARRSIKRGLQRGWRGWSDEDVWSLSWYTSKVICESLKRLNKIGIILRTGEVYNPEKDIGPDNDPDMDFDTKERKRIVTEILWAWDITRKISEGTRYSYRPKEPKNAKKFLTIKEEMRRIKGLYLWINHFQSLSD